jgi:hypothetical protein
MQSRSAHRPLATRETAGEIDEQPEIPIAAPRERAAYIQVGVETERLRVPNTTVPWFLSRPKPGTA